MRKGQRTPDAVRAKMSASNVGKKRSEEAKAKMSAAHKGKKLSDAHKLAIGRSGKGRICSEDTKSKISKANKGRKHSDETRRKIGDTSRGRKLSDDTKRKMSNAHIGRKKSAQHAKNISLGLKRLYAEHPEKAKQNADARRGKPLSDAHKASLSLAQYRRWERGETKDVLIPHLLGNLAAQGHHESIKSGVVYYRSSYELKFYKLLDSDINVSYYEVESERLEYKFRGRVKTYIPDVKVFYINGDWKVFEVKPQYALEDDINLAKISAAKLHYGERFAIVTEKELGLPL